MDVVYALGIGDVNDTARFHPLHLEICSGLIKTPLRANA
jgi:hypothetical protein